MNRLPTTERDLELGLEEGGDFQIRGRLGVSIFTFVGAIVANRSFAPVREREVFLLYPPRRRNRSASH